MPGHIKTSRGRNTLTLSPAFLVTEKKEGILIKSDAIDNKLTWEDTFKQMAKDKEDWSDFKVLASDGIE